LGIGPHSSLVIVLVGIDNTDLDGSVCVKLIRASDGFIRWRIGADRSSVYSVSLSLSLSLSLSGLVARPCTTATQHRSIHHVQPLISSVSTQRTFRARFGEFSRPS